MMDLNIAQLDSEERKKINLLLKERNDADKNKGVNYIFKQSDDKEDLLMGKKIDLSKMVKDDKALMGESEAEFQERMESRKLMHKIREDPMAIIELNEQQALKVALEKQRVHQKLSKTYNSKFQRNQNVSSSDSDSDIIESFISLMDKQINNVELESIKNVLNQYEPGSGIQGYSKNRNLSKSPDRRYNRVRKPHRRNESRSPSPKYTNRNRRDNEKNKRRSKSKERKNYSPKRVSKRDESNHRPRYHDNQPARRSRSRSGDRSGRNGNNYEREQRRNERVVEKKPRLSKEEIARRLQEMRDNANELDVTTGNLDRKFKRNDEEEEAEVEKNLKHKDEYMFKEMVKLSGNNKYSLESNIRQRNKQNQISKLFNS